MTAAGIDGNALNAQRTAQAAARDGARSVVLGRFDAADARRRFSLDQDRLDRATEARADRAAGVAKHRAEARDAASDRAAAEGRRDGPKSDRPDRIADGHRPDRPRTVATRSESGGARSAGHGANAESASPAAAKTDSAGKSPASAQAGHGKGTAAEAKPAAETAPSAIAPVAAAPTPAEAPLGGISQVAPESEQPESAAGPSPGDLAGKAAGSIGDVAREAAEPAGAAIQAGSSEEAADFSSILGAAEAPAASPAASAAAKPAAVTAAADTALAQPSTPPVPLGAVPMTIALRSLQNAGRFEIRLDPIELGRIDVRLDVDKDAGTVSADLVVDRPSTLALLQRDASTLQQALAQAGLDASAGISLSLRDGGGRENGNGTPRQQPIPHGAQPQTGTLETDPTPLRALRLSGLDIRI